MKPSKHFNLFIIVQDKETKKYFITVGNYRISAKTFDKEEQAEQYIATKPYEIITNLICLFVDLNTKKENENKKENS